MKYDFSKNIGHSGLLCQRDLDCGDTAQRVGAFYLLATILKLDKSYTGQPLLEKSTMDFFLLAEGSLFDGRYRRHSNPYASWYSARQLSRDQKSILMLGMAAMKRDMSLFHAFLDNAKRLFFHQNTLADDGISWQIPDIMNPHEFANIIRGLGLKWLYPLLYILDSLFFLDLYFRKKTPWDYDNLLALNLFYAVYKYPTFVSKFIFKLYQKTDFLLRIKAYHKDFHNGVPALYDMFVDANEELKRRLNI